MLRSALRPAVRRWRWFRFSPRRLVWIFAFPRSGTTWLGRMLSDLGANALWNEPMVGGLFGRFYLDVDAERRADEFILAPAHREAWLRSIRDMVVRGAARRFPHLRRRALLVVKEPNGSLGAPLLSAAMPESRFIFMLRDPRDLVASLLDAQRSGGWVEDLPVWKGREKPLSLADTDPEEFVREVSEQYVRSIEQVEKAYLTHPGPKAMVRYEDLRAEPQRELRDLCGKLKIDATDAELARAVERRAWDEIPAEERGEQKFFRKATPGAWAEDLTRRQAELVEEIAEPVLSRFYGEPQRAT